ncbi:hypothetical protein B0H13DRAFT_2676167 [Mycena leptocephala]|nr:hypothetical protein B0H13DRAFT_2676167 [Mycena leptocephala]
MPLVADARRAPHITVSTTNRMRSAGGGPHSSPAPPFSASRPQQTLRRQSPRPSPARLHRPHCRRCLAAGRGRFLPDAATLILPSPDHHRRRNASTRPTSNLRASVGRRAALPLCAVHEAVPGPLLAAPPTALVSTTGTTFRGPRLCGRFPIAHDASIVFPPQHLFPIADFAFVPSSCAPSLPPTVLPPIDVRPLVLSVSGTHSPFILRSPPPRTAQALDSLPRRTIQSKSAPTHHHMQPAATLSARHRPAPLVPCRASRLRRTLHVAATSRFQICHAALDFTRLSSSRMRVRTEFECTQEVCDSD